MLSINDLSISFGAIPLLKEVSFIVNKGEKIALTGKNGAGKTTLLRIVAGQMSPSSGAVIFNKNIKIGYLPQQMDISDSTSLIEETRTAFSDIVKINLALENAVAQLENELSGDAKIQASLIDRIESLSHQVQLNSASEMEAEMETTLKGLGFSKNDFNRPTAEFSGGWRMRIELAKILLQKPDILLLDEPTNHLDIESIQWLEKFLINKNKTLIVISHDKAFLDNVTNRTIEINCGRVYDYKVPYSQFIVLREERLQQQRRAFENQQKEIADIKEFVERFRYKATKAVQVQSRLKQLEKIKPIEIDETDNRQISVRFLPAPRSGDFPIIAENVGKKYGNLLVFENATFTLRRGEKVAFVGKNGEGKSTLVKCIMNEIDFEGSLKIGHNISIGYFAQNAAQFLDGKLTVFETVDNVAVGEIRTRLKDLLAAFLFTGYDIEKKVSVLSGGEKTRLALLLMLLKPCNLLILDEPTNHLDIRSKEILKEALRNFEGTLIVVSHDRDFLDGLVEKVYEFGNKKVREHLGGIYDFLRSKGMLDIREIEAKPSGNLSKSTSSVRVTVSKISGKEEYERQKTLERNRKRCEREINNIEKEIETVESRLNSLEDKIGSGLFSDDIMREYEANKNTLEMLMERWEDANKQLMES